MRRTETHLAAAQRIAHVGSWEAELRSMDDFSQNPLWWSDETFRIFGYEPGAVAVTHELFGDAVAPEDRLRVWNEVLAALRERKRYDVEHSILRPDGEVRVVREHAEVLCDPATGNPARFIGTVQDITGQKQVEEALRKSEARLIEAQRIGYIGSWEADLITNQLIWTDEIYRIFEVERGVSGASYDVFRKTVHPEDRERVQQAFDDSVSNKTPYDITHRLLMPDGRVKYVRERAETRYDSQGRPVRSAGTVQDITEQKRVEDALRASEASFRQVIEASPVPLSVDGTDRKIEYLNRKFIETFGYTHEELSTRDDWFVRAYPNPEYRQAVARLWEAAVARACAEGKPIGPVETEVTCKDGSIRTVEFVGTAVGHRLMIAAKDLTEHRRAEDVIRASLKEKTVLLKEVHHRVKNNLQIVTSLLNLQAVRIKNPEALDTLRETANRVRSMALLHETLYLSQSLARVNFASYIDNICSHLFRSYGPKAKHIKLDLRLENAVIDLDQTVSCGLMVNELVSNALKHAFPGGRPGKITVELQTAPQDRIVLTIADDGVGLPPGLDIHQTETLGHQLVYMLAEKLRGTVDVTRNCGTVFCIAFQARLGEERL